MMSKNLLHIAPYPGSTRPWPSVHLDCGQVCSPSYTSVARAGNGGCKPCSYKHRQLPKIRAPRPYQRGFKGDQTAIRAWAIHEKHFLPSEPCPGVSHTWRGWCMDCWQPVNPKVDSMRKPGAGCCFDCGKRRGGDKLRTPVGPVMDKLRDHGFAPDPAHRFTRLIDPWPGTCAAKGHPWNARPTDVFTGHRCPKCMGNQRTSESHARRQLETMGLELVGEWPGSIQRPVPVKGPCGHTWEPTLANLIHANSRCPSCANHGFDPSRPAFVYVLWHPLLESVKFGIRGAHTKRIEAHKGQKWTLHNELYFEEGAHAREVEDLMRTHIRQVLRIPQHLTAGEMPQRGATETSCRLLLDERAAWQVVLDMAKLHRTVRSSLNSAPAPPPTQSPTSAEQLPFEF